MAKFTDVDVDELVTAIRREAGKFAILTGAGCSMEAKIPSGTQIASEICAAYPLETSSLDKNEKKDYGLCMARIPFAKRKQIIDSHLNSKKVKINWANIALARLIDKKFISRVLTFNFDSILTRSCGLLGLYPATYDFGVAPWSKTKHLAEPCIIHLHGQGSGSAMMNTAEETRKHAEALQPLLKDTFERFPLIVIGYSGCSDQVFPKIKELYDGEQSLYWLGHKDDPDPHIAEFFKGNHTHYCKYIGGIDADTFLIQLAQKLGCFPPQVFADPAGHLLVEMKDIAPYPLKDVDPTDILENTIKLLTKHQKTLQFTSTQTAVLSDKPADIDTSDKTIPTEIQAWALFKLGNKHVETAKKINSISEYEKSARQYEAALKIKPDMHEALHNWGTTLVDLAELKKETTLLSAAFAKYEAALMIKPNMHEAFYNWGNALLKLAQLEEDPALFEASFAKYEAALMIKPDMHEAFLNWGTALLDLAQLKQEPALFDASFAKYEAALKFKPDKHEALLNWGNALLRLAQLKQESALFEASFAKYEAALMIKPDLHEALLNWGTALSDLAQLKQEPALFDASFAKYEAALKIKPDKHAAHNNWGHALIQKWKLTNDSKYLEQANEVISQAEKLSPNDCYNGACLAAIKNDEEGCKARLFRNKAAKTLPPRKHLKIDPDLANVRDKPWFAELLTDL
jgi:tetratricopeptide (TPR) repeat protein